MLCPNVRAMNLFAFLAVEIWVNEYFFTQSSKELTERHQVTS